MGRIFKYVMLDILKNKFVIAYMVMMSLVAWSAFTLEDNSAKGMLTLLNLILLTVPLVSVLFSAIYIYNSSEFIELLVSQPIKRSKIWLSLYWGLCGSLVTAFIIGAGIPLLLFAEFTISLLMLVVGILITVIFVSLALLSTIIYRDKAKGIGLTILIWIYFALLFDGLLLFLMFQFADYPIEKPMVLMTALSPLDLSRILLLLQLDSTAIMGYTGAIFRNFFGNSVGMSISFTLLILWSTIPFLVSLKKFKKKDL
ncbi:ABC transporter permease [Sediminibacterium sp.]|uniref:ABC transporter permease n=1 Tax=Sediminibacterium sp. TaxID=1917865 RepID=UPI0025EDBADE|nr:ABC transporter permease [Sediminibacterium sp.]MBT9484752.1 ABC transporter permease [Sediminibacterium sp.]